MTRSLEAELRLLRDGLPKLLPADETLNVRRVVKPVADWIAQLDGRIRAKEAVRAAQTAAALLLSRDMKQRKADRDLLAGLHSTLKNHFGSGHPSLKPLGIRRSEGRPVGSKPPAAVQAAASAQMVATKKRRGILGKRQRARIPPAPPVALSPAGADAGSAPRPPRKKP